LKQPRLFRVAYILESFEPFGLPFVWINKASDTEKVHKRKKYGGTTCCVPLCGSNSAKNPELSFHKFPVDSSFIKRNMDEFFGNTKSTFKKPQNVFLTLSRWKEIFWSIASSC
jgi:hypothetical protein